LNYHLWNELKHYESNNYTFYEFKDQYEDVFQKTGKKIFRNRSNGKELIK